MSTDLDGELSSHKLVCSHILKSRLRRIGELEQLVRAKYSEIVSSCSDYHQALGSFERIAVEGLTALFHSLAEDLRVMNCELLDKHDKKMATHEAAFERLLLERKSFEVEQYLPLLIEKRKAYLKAEIELLDELSNSRENEQETAKSQIAQISKEVESLPSQQIRERHKLEYEVGVFTMGIEERIRLQRKAKKDTIKLHTVRNDLRAEHARESKKAETVNRKLNSELERLTKNVEFFETKLSQIAKINESKYERILESNLGEIKYHSAQLVEGIERVYKDIFDIPWQPSSECATEMNCSETFKILSSPASDDQIAELEEIHTLLLQQFALLNERRM